MTWARSESFMAVQTRLIPRRERCQMRVWSWRHDRTPGARATGDSGAAIGPAVTRRTNGTGGRMLGLDRRRLLHGSAIFGGMQLSGCANTPDQGTPGAVEVPPLAPVRANMDRLFNITVC